MARIPLITETSELTAEQRRVVDGILGRRGGRMPGPFRLSLHCPEITEASHPLGETLRLKSHFPLRLLHDGGDDDPCPPDAGAGRRGLPPRAARRAPEMESKSSDEREGHDA